MILIYSPILDDLKMYYYDEHMTLCLTYCSGNVTTRSSFRSLKELRDFFRDEDVIIHDDGAD